MQEGNKRNITPCYNVVDIDRIEIRAIIDRTHLNTRDTVANRHAREAPATRERAIANARDTVWNRHAREAPATLKRIPPDSRNRQAFICTRNYKVGIGTSANTCDGIGNSIIIQGKFESLAGRFLGLGCRSASLCGRVRLGRCTAARGRFGLGGGTHIVVRFGFKYRTAPCGNFPTCRGLGLG